MFGRHMLKLLGNRFWSTLGIVCVPIAMYDLIGYPATVVGTSMEPTLHGAHSMWWNRDIVWLSRLSTGNLKAGDIVAFTPPDDPDVLHIKRLSMQDRKTYRCTHSGLVYEVPKGLYWMQSDNPNGSRDSSIYGPVCQNLIAAKATYILWPPSRWTKL